MVGVQDASLIYTLAGGLVVNNILGWSNGISNQCGGVVGTLATGNSVTLIFN
ncbi:hypothetical protein FRB95_002929, partial [Tulasnella sp. JGI-2019a]